MENDTDIDGQDETVPAVGEQTLAGFQDLQKYLRRFKKGEIVCDQGEPGDTMFFIQEGRVRIIKISQAREQPLAVLEAGSFFGEMAVLNQEPRTARAETLTDCVLIEIDGRILNDFLASHPDVARRVIRTMAERLRDTDRLVERLLDGDPMIQVIDAILALAEESDESPPYISDVQRLMVESGTDPLLCRGVLSRMRTAGFIAIDDQGIRIAQMGRMRDYLTFLRVQQDWLKPG